MENYKKESSLLVIKQKLDALYEKFEGEANEDLLYHYAENGQVLFTSLACFDKSKGNYGVVLNAYTEKNGENEDIDIYRGDDFEVADQVFGNVLKGLDIDAIWKEEDGTYEM